MLGRRYKRTEYASSYYVMLISTYFPFKPKYLLRIFWKLVLSECLHGLEWFMVSLSTNSHRT